MHSLSYRSVLQVGSRTLKRWRQWWLDHFVRSSFSKAARTRFMPPVCERTLPLSLWLRFELERHHRLLAMRLGLRVDGVLCLVPGRPSHHMGLIKDDLGLRKIFDCSLQIGWTHIHGDDLNLPRITSMLAQGLGKGAERFGTASFDHHRRNPARWSRNGAPAGRWSHERQSAPQPPNYAGLGLARHSGSAPATNERRFPATNRQFRRRASGRSRA